MIPVFEQAKKVHASDRAATVIGNTVIACLNYSVEMKRVP
jgi:hypothetical protein